MVALYNGYITPFIIMFTVPVAVVGALGALALTHQTLNLFSLIGAILLVGLVAKNGILLVDFANQLRERGSLSSKRSRERARAIPSDRHDDHCDDRRHAAVSAGARSGSQAERPLGIVVIGGLSSSLVLTLLLIPIMYLRFAPSTTASPGLTARSIRTRSNCRWRRLPAIASAALCFFGFDGAIARLRVGHERAEKFPGNVAYSVDGVRERCFVRFGGMRETAELADELDG